MTAEPDAVDADPVDLDAEADAILEESIEELRDEQAILFLGQKFAIREHRSAMAIMTWMDAVDRRVELGSVEGYRFLLRQLKATVTPEDWARFEAHAMDTEANASQLLRAVECGIAVVVNLPTERPADSSDGPSTTEPSSSGSSSSPESSTPEPSPRARQIAEQTKDMVPVALAGKRALKAKRDRAAAGRPA